MARGSGNDGAPRARGRRGRALWRFCGASLAVARESAGGDLEEASKEEEREVVERPDAFPAPVRTS
jgi:hypothetical protein